MDKEPLHILDRTAHEQEVDVACNTRGQECLVVFQEQFSNLTGPYGITGRPVFTDRTMGSLFGIVGPYPGLSRTNPAIVSGPPGFLTVWEHDRAGTSFQDTHGRLYWPHVTFLPTMFN